MKDQEKRKKAKEFVEYWKKSQKNEKQDYQTFWNTFLRDILEVKNPEKVIEYQKPTDSNKTQWIDAYIKETHIIIEQKSGGVDLLEPSHQSDGSMKNAFEQAKNYDDNMNKANKADWIVTCNFDKFLIYNMNDIKKKYIEIKLEELPMCYDNFNFLIDKSAQVNDLETAVSKEAGKIIGNIYNEIEQLLIKQDSLNETTQKYLNEFCVRLVFCCFAEDSGLFAKRQFRDFVEKAGIEHLQSDLLELFEVLNEKDRRPFLSEKLKAFPYVNGELFADKIDIPPLNESIRELILTDACDGFDWSKINPTIFGAIFESTLNPDTRRKGGMHYTSIENIHKVIDPLFLNELKKEFSDIRKSSQINAKINKLNLLQDKISKLVFLDPACGSGNFLTETYLELRRLENNILREKIKTNKGEREMFSPDTKDLIKVHIQQFYGIEINDFAVAVSKTALWIAEYQMYLETLDLYMNFTNISDFLPLDSYSNITESNALKIDWNTVVKNTKCNYVIGNPPFVGARKKDENQKQDLLDLFNGVENVCELDYVSGWYEKASTYMKDTNIKTVLVSTNSITQGEQPYILWRYLNNKGININFAYKTFRWDSEANLKAQVHCIIVCFSYLNNNGEKILFDGDRVIRCDNINGNLLDLPNIYIKSRSKPICDVPEMSKGSMPNDEGYLSKFSREYVDSIIKKYPESKPLFRRIYGSKEFTNNIERYCLWLQGIQPATFINIPPIMNAIEKVKQYRSNSNREATRKLSGVSHLFGEIRQPKEDYLVLPTTTTGKRDYIPMGFFKKDIIATNALQVMPKANLYHFGILESDAHMAWMRAITGRMKSDYQYSIDVVYNNFPWPNPSKAQKNKIIECSKAILKAREVYKNVSLTDLYKGDMNLYQELLKAHQANNKAVWEAYGKKWNINSETECVEYLMSLYNKLIDNVADSKNV